MYRTINGYGAALAAGVLALVLSGMPINGAEAQVTGQLKKAAAKGKLADKLKAKADAQTDAAKADAKDKADPKAKVDAKAKPDPKAKADAKGKPAAGKPLQVGTYGDWGAYVTQGAKEKTCYALAKPGQRLPSGLNRDPAYVFISTRPGENVKNEVSIIMGFGMKDGTEASADIGGEAFELLGKGANAWVKNAAKEPQFVDALRKGSKLTIKAASVKGNVTTDHYSLSGLGQALERVAKECP